MTVFYHPDLEANTVVLSVEESRHCIKAMRKRAGDTVHLTDGKGMLAEAEIVSADLTGCVVSIIWREEIPARRLRLHLAVAPTKNADRMEWLTEKAVEIGIEKISFIICEHSERPKIDMNGCEELPLPPSSNRRPAIFRKWKPSSSRISLNGKRATTPCDTSHGAMRTTIRSWYTKHFPKERFFCSLDPKATSATQRLRCAER